MATAYALAELLLARLTGTPGLQVFDAEIPAKPGPTGWVIVYPGAGRAHSTLLGTVADRLDWDATLVCCGRTRQQCLNTVEIVRGRLTGIRLGAARSSSPLAEDVSGPVIPDQTIPTEPRYSITVRYRSDHHRS